MLYAHNIMAGNSRTFDQILGCKTRNEFDAQPVSALSAQIDSFSGVTLSTFEAIKIVIEKSVRKHVLSTPSKLHFCRNYLVVFCPLSLLSLMLIQFWLICSSCQKCCHLPTSQNTYSRS